ncbi:synaptic vesicular amine transporter-like [Littorina saxatilis]|uniref:Major facilitator superfamily (MFS) profile domain-containing protein n=1 Tax=Littorina saxatilis TaxID=31220 RepID=A0AAN9GKB0_9CAEN
MAASGASWAEWLTTTRQKAESSTRLVLSIVFITNMLDNLLLTSVVPIIPSFLLHLDKEAFDEANNQTTAQHVPTNGSSSNNLVDESLVKHAFSLAAVADSENSRVGWLLSSKAIVQLIANPFVGPLCSRVGYPVMLFCGCFVIFLSSLVFAVSQTFVPLLLARGVQGLGSAASSIAGMSLVAERYPDDRGRSKAMGIAMGGAAVGILFGYPYGGFMYTFVGKVTPFLIISALTLLDLVFQFFVLGLQPKEGAATKFTPLHILLRDPYILVASGAVMLTTMSMAVLEPTVPLWVMKTMHVEKWQLGLVFLPDSIGYLIGTNCFGLVARRVGRWICTLACILLISVCLVCLPFANEVPQLILPHLGLGLGLGITDAAVMPLLALLVDTRHDSFYGCVYAIVQLAVCLAYSVGPSMAGIIVKAVGFPWLMRGMAIINIIFCPFCVLLKQAPVATDEGISLNTAVDASPRYTEDKVEDSSFSYGRLDEEED